MKQGKYYLTTITILMLFFVPLVGYHEKEVFSPWILSHVKTVVSDYFASSLEDIRLKPLAGGYSNAVNLQLEIGDKTYVLRINNELESPLKLNTELYAMKEAAAAGIAPAIHWISPDGYAILIDYISGGTLSIEKSREPEIIFKIADLLRKTHALPKNPFCAPSFKEQMEDFYKKYSQKGSHQSIWSEALSIIKEGASQLSALNAPTVSTHGDLNPRNILVSGQDVYFIDWGDGTYSDPFLDLAYFSITMNYAPKEETFFLQCYLDHIPSLNERKRFRISKKMNFARLALAGQGIGNRLSSDQGNEEGVIKHSREWSYYASIFANDDKSLSAQFFWGLAQTALQSAKALDLNDVD
jgi:aminoglycoside phosphotransferase (APT) family kinase protein